MENKIPRQRQNPRLQSGPAYNMEQFLTFNSKSKIQEVLQVDEKMIPSYHKAAGKAALNYSWHTVHAFLHLS